MGSIYVLTFPNKKQYVGQTIEGISKRMSGHRTSTRAGCSLLIHKAMRKYGLWAFDIEEIDTLECTQEELDKIEQETIESLGTLAPNGYNIAPGGRGGGGKIRKGRPGTMTGKKHSKEARAKIAAASAKRRLSEETKTKIAASKRGKPNPHEGVLRSEEAKKKISMAQKIRWQKIKQERE